VQHLNQHIDYNDLHTDGGADHAAINAQIPHSLATPLQPTISSDGNTIYIPAFGSAKIGVFTRTELEDPSFEANFDPTVESADYLATTGGGPSGVALDETNNRLYVMTRFNNSVEVIDLGSGTTSAVHTLHNPEDASIVDGRPFLYDAVATSGNGEASCSSCHLFGDLDALAWNLGNPDDVLSTNNQPQPNPLLEIADPTGPFHPMKGPMTTQTLRGMSTHGALHWRGDRVDGFFGTDPCTEPGYAVANSTNAPCDEVNAFKNFIVAFEGLVGMEGTVSGVQMQAFADFMLQVQLPPNPVRALDNSLTTAEQNGEDKWFSCGPGATECAVLDPLATDTVEDCDGCHSLDPLNGFFGSGGEQSFEGEPQHFKVAHNRNDYQKVGMFFAAGDQVRGTGILHDGSVDTIKTFLSSGPFTLTNSEEDDLEQFILAFPTDIAPIVGQQVTISPANFSVTDVNDRIDLIDTRAGVAFESAVLGGVVTECDAIAKTVEGGVEKGYVRQSGGSYLPDRGCAARQGQPGGRRPDDHLHGRAARLGRADGHRPRRGHAPERCRDEYRHLRGRERHRYQPDSRGHGRRRLRRRRRSLGGHGSEQPVRVSRLHSRAGPARNRDGGARGPDADSGRCRLAPPESLTGLARTAAPPTTCGRGSAQFEHVASDGQRSLFGRIDLDHVEPRL